MKYQDYSFYKKIISSSRAVSFTCEDIGVAVATNMISQNFCLLHQDFDFLEQKI